MQSGEVLLWRLEQLGFKVSLEGGEVKIQPPPRRRVPKAAQEWIDGHKGEFISSIERRDERAKAGKDDPRRFFRGGPCPSCRKVDYWISVHNHIACMTCHPPGDRFMVRGYVGAREVSNEDRNQ